MLKVNNAQERNTVLLGGNTQKRRHICSSPVTQKQQRVRCARAISWLTKKSGGISSECVFPYQLFLKHNHQSYLTYTAVTSEKKTQPTNKSIQRQVQVCKAQIQALNVCYLHQRRCSISALVVLSCLRSFITCLLCCLSTLRKATLEPQEIHPSPLGEKPQMPSPGASQQPGTLGNLHQDHIYWGLCLLKAQPLTSAQHAPRHVSTITFKPSSTTTSQIWLDLTGGIVCGLDCVTIVWDK